MDAVQRSRYPSPNPTFKTSIPPDGRRLNQLVGLSCSMDTFTQQKYEFIGHAREFADDQCRLSSSARHRHHRGDPMCPREWS